MPHNTNRPSGFTIVELLVVIVIIGILASVVVVAYNGISGRAVTASLQSDLTQAKKQIETFNAVNGSYPTANNCTNTLDTEICLKASPSNTLSYTTFTLNSQTTYSVTATRGTTSNTVTGGTTPSIVTDGLVLHLDAGNPASYPGSGTTWTDLSGNNNNGTLINGPTYSSANGGSIVFDGVNDYVDIPASNSLKFTTNGEFSISMWLMPNTLTSTWRRSIMSSEIYLSGGYRFGINATGYPIFWTDQSGGSLSFTASMPLTISVRNHLAVTFNNQQAYIYLNGVQVGSAIGVFITTFNNTQLGRISGNTNSYAGNMDVITIYNRALTASEISQNFNAVRSRFGI